MAAPLHRHGPADTERSPEAGPEVPGTAMMPLPSTKQILYYTIGKSVPFSNTYNLFFLPFQSSDFSYTHTKIVLRLLRP